MDRFENPSASLAARVLTRLRALPQTLLIGLVQFYRLFFRHWVGPVCRYEPSCSTYALQALQQHGAGRGAVLTASRLLRCNPWCLGGHDPVPPVRGPGLFTGLLGNPGQQDTVSTRTRS